LPKYAVKIFVNYQLGKYINMKLVISCVARFSIGAGGEVNNIGMMGEQANNFSQPHLCLFFP
jgi:hypothetical protein